MCCVHGQSTPLVTGYAPYPKTVPPRKTLQTSKCGPARTSARNDRASSAPQESCDSIDNTTHDLHDRKMPIGHCKYRGSSSSRNAPLSCALWKSCLRPVSVSLSSVGLQTGKCCGTCVPALRVSFARIYAVYHGDFESSERESSD